MYDFNFKPVIILAYIGLAAIVIGGIVGGIVGLSWVLHHVRVI